MDFEDFAQQFRKRAADRLTEFEKSLEKSQRDLEKTAARAAAQAKDAASSQQRQPGQPGQPGRPAQRSQAVAPNRPLDYRTPDIPGAVPQQQRQSAQEQQQTPTPRRAPGQVKSVLRKG